MSALSWSVLAQAKREPAPTKMIPIETAYGTFKVSTQFIGNGDEKITMLKLHGGPGADPGYFGVFKAPLAKEKIGHYDYAQLGSRGSDQPNETRLWEVDRFRDEVEQVRKALGLKSFYLYGHSWGGILAIEYALKYPEHLKGLIISNMNGAAKPYIERVQKIRGKLPAGVRREMEAFEAKEDYGNPRYQELLYTHFYSKYLIQTVPMPKPVEETLTNINPQIYTKMQGPNEFVVTGTLKDWDRMKDLPRIKVPTLVLGGTKDEMDPANLREMGKRLPNARVSLIRGGSHMAMYDQSETYFKRLTTFVKDVEAGKFGKAAGTLKKEAGKREASRVAKVKR